jgi:hypothetical protein
VKKIGLFLVLVFVLFSFGCVEDGSEVSTEDTLTVYNSLKSNSEKLKDFKISYYASLDLEEEPVNLEIGFMKKDSEEKYSMEAVFPEKPGSKSISNVFKNESGFFVCSGAETSEKYYFDCRKLGSEEMEHMYFLKLLKIFKEILFIPEFDFQDSSSFSVEVRQKRTKLTGRNCNTFVFEFSPDFFEKQESAFLEVHEFSSKQPFWFMQNTTLEVCLDEEYGFPLKTEVYKNSFSGRELELKTTLKEFSTGVSDEDFALPPHTSLHDYVTNFTTPKHTPTSPKQIHASCLGASETTNGTIFVMNAGNEEINASDGLLVKVGSQDFWIESLEVGQSIAVNSSELKVNLYSGVTGMVYGDKVAPATFAC